MSLNLSQICRLCLMESPKQTYNIFNEYYVQRKSTAAHQILYSDLLSSCTKLKPSADDGLPNLICNECVKTLKMIYKFNIQCEESDTKLKEYLETLETKGKENENNEEAELKTFDELLRDGIKHDLSAVEVKLENGFEELGSLEDDSFWDADDENIMLSDVKSKKDIKVEKIIENGVSEKPKKKRGRPKKIIDDPTAPKNSKMPHQCDVCGRVLSNKSNLKAHMICHTDLRPYKCELCPSSFRCYSGLFQHRKVHSKATPYHCEYCPKQFGRRTGLVNHVRIHTGDKDFTCDVCFKKFTQSAQLYVHLKRHKGDKTFLCQNCGKGFPIKSDLKVHQRIHSGEKPYLCKLCPKTFATAGNLSIHVRIHNKEIRYVCKYCSRGFVCRSSFNVHVKRHQGRRDHACDCGKTFYTSSALKQHKVVHTGEKKYSCRICEKKFTQASHLNRHMKKDHPKEVKPKVVEPRIHIAEPPPVPLLLIERSVGGSVTDVKRIKIE